MSIEEMLGIDDTDPLGQLAYRLVSGDSDFINNLIAWREERGLTQAQVAERMGVSEEAVKQFEHYDSNPTLNLIRRYALSVGVMVRHEVESVIDE